MEVRTSKAIEVTVISAEGLLENRRKPVRKNAFVVVKSDPGNPISTGVDSEGGSYPSWNQKLEMELQAHVRFIAVEAHSGSKVIGSANIPVTDFSGGYLPENYLSFLSYRLRDANGEKNGIINLSVKVKGGVKSGYAASCSRPWIRAPMDDKVANAIVTGIPVSRLSALFSIVPAIIIEPIASPMPLSSPAKGSSSSWPSKM